MRPAKQNQESLEAAHSALDAEIRETARVSRHLNDNLLKAIRLTWRQLLLSWVVIILSISYLAVLGYAPAATNTAHLKRPTQPNSREQMDTAELPQVSRSSIPGALERRSMLKPLEQIRDAHYKKDIQLFLKAYSPAFSDLGQKKELTFKSWQRYDYLDAQFYVTGVQQENDTTFSGIVTWNIKIRDHRNNAIETLSKNYNVEFIKESRQWLIYKIEAPDNKVMKNQGYIY